MITYEEVNPNDYELDEEQFRNITILLDRMNVVRKKYGKPMIITSGVRSKNDHKRIYKEKGISEDKIPWGSMHLKGAAVDVYDPKGLLWKWVKENVDLMIHLGLWIEEDTSVPRVHFQIYPPKSGKRFFKP